MSYYVKRTHPETGRIGYVGPLRTISRATREAEAWRGSTTSLGNRWTADVLESSPEVKVQVRAWQKAVEANR